MVCPFCNNKKSETLKSYKYWNILVNKYPRVNKSILLTPNRHILYFNELNKKELSELIKILPDICKRFKDFFNSWNIEINNGVLSKSTVEHLHIHFKPRRKKQIESIEERKELTKEDFKWLKKIYE